MARAFSLPPDPPLGSLWLRVLDPHAHSVYPGRAHYRHGLRVPLEEHLLLMAPPRTFKTAFLADVPPLLAADEAATFDDEAGRTAFRTVYSTFIKHLPGNAWAQSAETAERLGMLDLAKD